MDDVDENRSLDGLLVQLLRAAGLSDTRPAVYDDLAVSVSEALALLELRASGGATQGQVVNRLGLEKSTVSRLAAGLERYVRLALTHAGQAVATHVWSTWQERHARILAALTDTERAGLAIGLGGLVRALAAEGLLGNPAPGDHSREPGGPHG
jgi:DNA-binding MarR family transcriptional regulator